MAPAQSPAQNLPESRALRLAAHFTPAPALKTLTSLQQVRELSADEASRAYPVRLRAVVTYLDSAVPWLFLQDKTNGIYVFSPHATTNRSLAVGQLVDVAAVTGPGQFAPILVEPQIIVLGDTQLPEPKRLPFDQYVQGQHECQWAELEGVVQSGEQKQGQLSLNVHTIGGTVLVFLSHYAGDWRRTLVRSKVRLTGVIAAISNEHRQAVGVRMFVSASHLEVLEPAPEDPFQLPIATAASVGEIRSEEDAPRAVRVRASVMAMEDGAIYISNGAQGLRAQVSASCDAKPGDLLDVVGFPGLLEDRPALENSVCRGAGSSPFRIEPLSVTPSQILAPAGVVDAPNYPFAAASRYDMRLVQMQGTLVQASAGPQGINLTLDSGPRLFFATLPPMRDATAERLRPGSRLQLTGLCIVNFDQFRHGQSLRLLLRTPDDIAVLSAAPWWNARRAALVACLGVGSLFASVLWIAALRTQVDRQTQQLQRANAALQRLSDRDGLTGVMNRRKFDEMLEVEFSRARRNSGWLSLIMIDIDCFKSLNDHYGHQRGDECLIEVVEALLMVSLRNEDVVARYGGEEFAVILSATNHQGALEVAERLRKSVRERSIPHLLSPFDQVLSISLGVATVKPKADDEPAWLIQLADRALYASKVGGRNRTTSMDAGPQAVRVR